uniref:Uncharacterized protein n=1 Tax=Mesocestoides corti TaxID=53468 RepID=A0A5K3FYI4_MESCO
MKRMSALRGHVGGRDLLDWTEAMPCLQHWLYSTKGPSYQNSTIQDTSEAFLLVCCGSHISGVASHRASGAVAKRECNSANRIVPYATRCRLFAIGHLCSSLAGFIQHSDVVK